MNKLVPFAGLVLSLGVTAPGALAPLLAGGDASR